MRKILCLVYLISIFIFLTGCWDYTPLENNYTITGIGIDIDDTSPDKILVSFVGPSQSLVSNSYQGKTSSNSTQDSYYYINASGDSIISATSNAQNKTSQTLTISNLRSIIISEAVAKKGIYKYLDPFLRNAQIHPNVFIFVTKGTAKDLLSLKGESISKIPLYLIDLISSSDYQIKPNIFTLKQATYALNSNYKAFILPYITINPKQKEISYENICLFKDDKMVDILSEGDSIGYFLLSGILKQELYVFDSDHYVNSEYAFDSDHYVNSEYEGSAFYLFPNKRTINVSIVKDHIEFDIFFKLTGETIEQASNNSVINNEASDATKEFDSLQKKDENKISSLLKKSIINELKKLQTEYKYDTLGLGEYVRVKYPDYFKNNSWEEEFQKAQFNIDVEVNIKGSGIMK